MYAEVEYEGRTFSIEISREGRVTVEEFTVVPTSGVLADVIADLDGKVAGMRLTLYVDRDMRYKVILACGWKFSNSQAWRTTWDFLYHQAGGKESGWGPKMVRRIR